MPPTRRINVRHSTVLLLTALLALAVVPYPQVRASASCAAPYLDLSERPKFERGDRVTIEGKAFVTGCQDSESCEVGCGADSCKSDDPPPTPMRGVQLRLQQGDRTWRLDVADAAAAEDNRLGQVSWSFELPADARPGPARLLADQAEPERVQIR